jgi:hypothetical protein
MQARRNRNRERDLDGKLIPKDEMEMGKVLGFDAAFEPSGASSSRAADDNGYLALSLDAKARANK